MEEGIEHLTVIHSMKIEDGLADFIFIINYYKIKVHFFARQGIKRIGWVYDKTFW